VKQWLYILSTHFSLFFLEDIFRLGRGRSIVNNRADPKKQSGCNNSSLSSPKKFKRLMETRSPKLAKVFGLPRALGRRLGRRPEDSRSGPNGAERQVRSRFRQSCATPRRSVARLQLMEDHQQRRFNNRADEYSRRDLSNSHDTSPSSSGTIY